MASVQNKKARAQRTAAPRRLTKQEASALAALDAWAAAATEEASPIDARWAAIHHLAHGRACAHPTITDALLIPLA